MIENEPASINVPAMRVAIRSMTEASSAEQRRFLMNAYGHARLRSADC